MKISHAELEACRGKPRKWLAERQTSEKTTYRKIGYDRALRLAIYSYHRDGDPELAIHHFRNLVKKHALKDTKRTGAAEMNLRSYMDWHRSSETITADHRVRIDLDVGGFLRLVGEVQRVDVTSDGYRGVLLGMQNSGWRKQLRMPLLQQAISIKFARPVEEVEICIQRLDGTSLRSTRFSRPAIQKARNEFLELGQSVWSFSAGR